MTKDSIIPDVDSMPISVSVPPEAKAETARRETIIAFMRDRDTERVIVHDNEGRPHSVTREMITSALESFPDDWQLGIHLRLVSDTPYATLGDVYGGAYISALAQYVRRFWERLWLACGVDPRAAVLAARAAEKERERQARAALREIEREERRRQKLLDGENALAGDADEEKIRMAKLASAMRAWGYGERGEHEVFVIADGEGRDRGVTRALVAACMRAQSPRTRQIIAYAVFKAYPIAVVAQRLQVSPEAVEADLRAFFASLLAHARIEA